VVTHNHICDTGISAFARASAIMCAILMQATSAAKVPLYQHRQCLRLVVLSCVVASFLSLWWALTCRAASTEVQTLPATPQAKQNNAKPLAIGFYVDWDSNGYTSLISHIQKLDWVVPSWLYLRGERMDLKTSLNPEVLDLIRTEKPDMRILAMIQNANAGEWDGINLARLLADPRSRGDRIKEIASFIETHSLQGVVIDFEQIQESAQEDMISFVSEVHTTFKEKGWIVSVAVPFDDPSYDYARYAKACDYLILMGYDEHWSGSDPGPIASYHWFSTLLATRMLGFTPSQTIIAIGNYGYDWTSGSKAAQSLTIPEVMERARKMNATVELDPVSLNPRYFYRHDGQAHQVWFLNSASAYYQVQAADSYRPAGYALWRLGGEDPAIWTVLPHAHGVLPALPSVK
jgi:spore germination protein YaaH